MKRHVFLFLLFFFFLHKMQAQQALWKTFGINNGLPVSTITAIAETNDGVMWLGSEEGLIRYDGISFKKIAGPVNASPPYVTAIVGGKNNDVWVGTRTGIWHYTPDGSFIKFKTPDHTSYFNDLKWNADSSLLYAATYDGLKVYIPDEKCTLKNVISKGALIRVFAHANNTYAFAYNALIRYNNDVADTIFHDASVAYQDAAWIEAEKKWLLVSAQRMILVDDQKNVSLFFFKAPVPLHKIPPYQALYITRDKHIWLNCTDSVFDFSGLRDDHPQIHYGEKSNDYSIGSDVMVMYEDRERNSWLGTIGEGLNFRDRRLWPVSFLHPHQLEAERVWNMYEDVPEQALIAGTNSGVRIFSGSGNCWKNIPNPQGIKRFTVTNISSYDKDHWVVSTFGSGLWLLDKHTYKYSQLPFFKDRHNTNGFVSFGNEEDFALTTGCMYRISRKEKKAVRFSDSTCRNTICMIKASDHTYWIGMGFGLIHANRQGKVLHSFNHNEQDSTSIRSDVVFSLFEGTDKKIYAGTMNGGLNCFDPATGKITHVPLVADPTHVYGIMSLNGEQILLTTSNGLYLYHSGNGTSRALNKTNGLPFNDFDQFSYLLTEKMFIGMGASGLLFIPRNDLLSLFKRTAAAKLFVNDMQAGSILLQPGQKEVRGFVSTGVSQSNDNFVFQYRMKGLEDTWHELKSPYELNYNYIPPGDYELEIRTTEPNNLVEVRSIVVPVSVLPLWWQTIWFRILVVLLGIACVVLLARYFSWLRLKWKLRRIEAEQKVAKERLRISRELHDNVGSQLTYLISGLEASEIMLQKQHTGKLVQNLEQLQVSARESMQQLRDAIWALNKEEMLLSTLTQRFKEWAEKITGQFPVELIFEVQVVNDAVLDPLKALNFFRMMQEAVHNALKHAEASRIEITITGNHDGITSMISDNGKGFVFDAAVHTSGLMGMHHRAAEVGGTRSIKSEPGKGTSIMFSIPK